MSASFGRGLHAAPGRAVSISAYERYLGRWSRLTVPDLLAAAQIAPGHRVLDVATGTGEAAAMAVPIVGQLGFVIGADISFEMVKSARARLDAPLYWPVNADGQALPFKDGAFDAVVCQLGLQFFPNPAAGLMEFHRVVRVGGMVAVCVNSTSDRLPMWGNLSDALDRFLTQDQRSVLALSWSLADRVRLARLFSDAGFQAIRVEQVRREATIDGFDDYWAPIEEGVGQIPQTYRALDESDRRAVREAVRARLAQYATRDGKMTMAVEMLIGSGRA
ncbi:MAG TPA: methyltransferase domain-containing protein [Acetobacteraceae bacterium]|jgi:ubiquinone/menaquinone biosynthesis C-methylase UbiE|nr:methyltransferase domain-containing protein [Acetobacteraceae bacterium]